MEALDIRVTNLNLKELEFYPSWKKSYALYGVRHFLKMLFSEKNLFSWEMEKEVQFDSKNFEKNIFRIYRQNLMRL